MEFQQFFNPLGYALQAQGAALANDGVQLDNSLKLYKLGTARVAYDQMMQDLQGASAGASAVAPPPGTPLNVMGQGQQGPTQQGPSSEMLFSRASNFDALAKRYKWTNPDLSEKYASRAESAVQNGVTAQEHEFTQKDKLLKDVQNAAFLGAESPEAMGRSFALLKQNLPPGMKWDQLVSNLGLDMGPNGLPRYDADKLQSIGQFSETAREKLKQDKEQRLVMAGLERDRRNDETLRMRQQAETRQAELARDAAYAGKLKPGMRWTDDTHTAQMPIPIVGDERPVIQEQKRLDQDALFKNYDRYHQAASTVQDIQAKIQAGTPVTPSDIQRLRAQYVNLLQDYRTRAGGAKDTQQFDKLNGNLQIMDKYLSTIGSATPAASASVVKQVLPTMMDAVIDRTADTAMLGLRSAANVVKRGGDPNKLQLKGDIDLLVRQGRATFGEDDDGTKRIKIKDSAGKEHEFVYPDGAY